MSIIQTLSEGIVNRDLKKEGSALLSKWEATGLLEGLDTEQARHNMARLLENQAKELLRESSSMSAGDVEGFASVAFPIVRRVFAGLIANELVSVQPMSLPSGLIFFLDFVYSPNVAGQADQANRLGNAPEKSIYGTNQVASQITGGVDLVGSQKENIGGLRQQVGYSYAHPTGSSALTSADLNQATSAGFKSVFKLDGSVSESRSKLIQYDPEHLASTSDGLGVLVLDVGVGRFENLDRELLSSISFSGSAAPTTLLDAINAQSSIGTVGAESEIKLIRRLTKIVKSADSALTHTTDAVRFVLTIAGLQNWVKILMLITTWMLRLN